MYELPKSITLCGNDYHIRNDGDFRMVIDCFLALQDEELDEQYRVESALIIFYDGCTEDNIFDIFNTQDLLDSAVIEMYNFFNCGQKTIGATRNHKVIDWEQDSQIITSAINKVANKEIRLEPYVHWWTFMGYYLAVGDCPLATIVGIREKLLSGKKLDKWEQDFRKDNPDYFMWKNRTADEIKADEYVRELWKSNSQKAGE